MDDSVDMHGRANPSQVYRAEIHCRKEIIDLGWGAFSNENFTGLSQGVFDAEGNQGII